MPTVALASEFLDAFAALPRAQQKKVREFTEKFKANPTSAAINYEKIHDVKDDKVRTVRIDQKYRAVVLHPEQGDVLRPRLGGQPRRGDGLGQEPGLRGQPGHRGAPGRQRRIEVRHPGRKPEEPERAGLFAAYDDDVLLSFGVPAVLLPSVRAVRRGQGPAQRWASTSRPRPMRRCCGWLREYRPEEVREAVAATGQEEGRSHGSGGRPGASRHQAPVRHHPHRRRTGGDARRPSGEVAGLPPPQPGEAGHPVIQRPGPSSGRGRDGQDGGGHAPGPAPGCKGLHRSDRPHPVHDLHGESGREHRGNPQDLCGAERDRIEVVHLHAWAVRFLRIHGHEKDIASPEEIEACWKEAISIVGCHGVRPGLPPQGMGGGGPGQRDRDTG